MPTTGKYTVKPYKCSKCQTEKLIGTNHWGDIYPYCKKCCKITVWNCLEPLPEGYEKPEPWKLVTLGEICEINIDRRR